MGVSIIFGTLAALAVIDSLIVLLFPKKSEAIIKNIMKKKMLRKFAVFEFFLGLIFIALGIVLSSS